MCGQGYVDFAKDEIPDEKSLMAGRPPKEIHVHAARYDVKELPQSEDELGKWLQERFRAKEQRLAKCPLSAAGAASATDDFALACSFYEGGRNSFGDSEGACVSDDNAAAVRRCLPTCPDPDECAQKLYLAAAVFVLLGGLTSYWLLTCSLFRWYALFATVGTWALNKYAGGIDRIEMRTHAAAVAAARKRN